MEMYAFLFPLGEKSLEKLENLEIVRFLPDKNWVTCIMNAQSQPSSQAHYNSFCFWADWNALIFGIHVQRRKNTLNLGKDIKKTWASQVAQW